MMAGRIEARRAFSLIEVIIVVVILGMIAAIAIPRMSHANQTAAENSLAGDLAVWRAALDLYQSQHGGAYPKNSATLVLQLTQYTDASGETSPTRDDRCIYGPCLRTVPSLPEVESSSSLAVPSGSTTVGPTLIGGAPSTIVPGGYGWLYDGAGNIYPNTGVLTDPTGKLYNSY